MFFIQSSSEDRGDRRCLSVSHSFFLSLASNDDKLLISLNYRSLLVILHSKELIARTQIYTYPRMKHIKHTHTTHAYTILPTFSRLLQSSLSAHEDYRIDLGSAIHFAHHGSLVESTTSCARVSSLNCY